MEHLRNWLSFEDNEKYNEEATLPVNANRK